ncbi:MAG: DNA polymerase IV [Thermoanaerobaculia bacterium]
MVRPPSPRVVLHLDMDAFYAAVEVREDPSLAGQPLIIGHRGRRGVVSTCSYEARRFGVHSAMPSVVAERLCPRAVWLPGRMSLYVEVSHAIREILERHSPLVEPLSIDEAFLDLTGIARDLADGRRIAAAIKQEIRDRERLTGSAGVAPNKFLAKVASDLEKPDGLVVFPLEEVPTRLWPLPVERLWGVGPKTAERLREQGLATIADLVNAPEGRLARLLGEASAEHLLALAHGRDDRAVHPGREAKSISEERTYGDDLTRPADVDKALLARADGVARELRREGLVARTVHLKVRTGDFETVTRSKTLSEPTDLAEVVLAAARELFRERVILKGRGVRLLGVGVSGLEAAGAGQAALFGDERAEKLRSLARAADGIREKFGKSALARARLLPPRGAAGEDEDGGADGEAAEASSLPTVD